MNGTRNNSNLQDAVLALRAGSYRCALPLACVAETMRPLPIQPLADMPSFVRGVSIIRGEPVPVVDLVRLLGQVDSPISRFVVVRVKQRKAALAVSEVIGIRDLEAMSLTAVPPLLQEARSQHVAALGAADEQLLVVLQTAKILPDEVWEALAK